MADTFAGFVDVAFLKKEGAKALGRRDQDTRLEAAGVVGWLKQRTWSGGKFLRAYWYDGAFAPEHRLAAAQRSYFEAVAMTPGVQLRLGHVAERPPAYQSGIRRAVAGAAEALGLDPAELLAEFNKRWEFRPVRAQKGVDTLIALDLVRLAGRGVIDTAVLISGDRDLAEAIRAAQDFGIEVLVATPRRNSVAREVAKLADGILDLTETQLAAMLLPRAST